MGKTISFVKGKGCLSHNNRDFVTKNVDRERMAWNEYYIQQPLKEAYEQIFGPAVAEYNANQKRKDRRIKDYLTDINNSGNNEKQFYEIVVQIGKKEDTGVVDENGELTETAKAAKEILDVYARNFQERNPNLYLFNAVLHMDEATPHLHLDYIPVAHGYKTKMHTRNSLTKALQEMGIAPALSKTDTETMHWQQREREYLMDMCRERGLEVEVLGEKRDNYTISEYKAARQAADVLTAELEILHAEKEEAENVIASIDTEVAGAKETLEESKQQLAEINEQISERKKKYETYESKLALVKDAEKPVKKELNKIRKNVKSTSNLLSSESYVKMPEKDFEKLMDLAQNAGTLERLNEAYDRDLDKMQSVIGNLSEQIKLLKDKLSKYEKFLKVKELVEEFKEFIRPKSLSERLERNKAVVERRELEAVRSRKNLKKHDMEI